MDSLPINVTDLAVIIVVVASGLLALVRGFFREILSVAAWVGAFFSTLYGHAFVEPFARQLIASPEGAFFAGIAGTFVVSLLVLSIAMHYISAALQHRSLSAVDRSLGLLFGLLRGAVLVSLSYLVLLWWQPEGQLPSAVAAARTQPLLERGARMLVGLLPAAKRPGISWRTTADDAAARDRQYRLMVDPPAKSAAPGTPSGYTDDQRRTMDQAVRKIQQ
jgi:membrane protein required for colicin V production